jgi:hypothetical protein
MISAKFLCSTSLRRHGRRKGLRRRLLLVGLARLPRNQDAKMMIRMPRKPGSSRGLAVRMVPIFHVLLLFRFWMDGFRNLCGFLFCWWYSGICPKTFSYICPLKTYVIWDLTEVTTTCACMVTADRLC